MGIELTEREEEMLFQALPMDGEPHKRLFKGLGAWESWHSLLNSSLPLFPLRSAENEWGKCIPCHRALIGDSASFSVILPSELINCCSMTHSGDWALNPQENKGEWVTRSHKGKKGAGAERRKWRWYLHVTLSVFSPSMFLSLREFTF